MQKIWVWERNENNASGILFMLTAPIFNFSSLIFHLDASGIISHKTLHDVIWIIINPRFIQYADQFITK